MTFLVAAVLPSTPSTSTCNGAEPPAGTVAAEGDAETQDPPVARTVNACDCDPLLNTVTVCGEPAPPSVVLEDDSALVESYPFEPGQKREKLRARGCHGLHRHKAVTVSLGSMPMRGVSRIVPTIALDTA